MSSELLLILSALVDISFVLFAARRGLNWLFGAVIVNLILFCIFGDKLINVFGLVTSAGNVFYACVFLATYFLLERHGKRKGLKTIWLGAGFVLFFIAMSQIATKFVGLPVTDVTNDAIVTFFSHSLRITIACIVAYIFGQYINIVIYEWLKERTRKKFLWLRSNGANVVAQLVDSLLFFTLAFSDLPGPFLVQTALAGWLIKIVVVAMGTPFLYVDAYLEERKT